MEDTKLKQEEVKEDETQEQESAEAISEEQTETAEEKAEQEAPLDLQKCRDALCPTCDVLAEANAIKLRSLAEMENFKKRLQKEKDEQVQYAGEKIITDLLPILDNFDLALQYGGTTDEGKNLMIGVEMVRTLLFDVLKKYGLSSVGNPGDTFDPNFHEAVSMEKSEEFDPNTIIRIEQKGYMLHKRVLRAAKVVVSSK